MTIQHLAHQQADSASHTIGIADQITLTGERNRILLILEQTINQRHQNGLTEAFFLHKWLELGKGRVTTGAIGL